MAWIHRNRGRWAAIALTWFAVGCSREPPMDSRPPPNRNWPQVPDSRLETKSPETLAPIKFPVEPPASNRNSMSAADWLPVVRIMGFAFALVVTLRMLLRWVEIDEQQVAEVEPPSETVPANSPASREFPRRNVRPYRPIPAIADFQFLYPFGAAPYAIFRGGSNGLWLQFRRDAEMFFDVRYDSGYPINSDRLDFQTSQRFLAGQTVRILDLMTRCDKSAYEPTVLALFGQVCVVPADAAVQVDYLPSLDDMRRFNNRSPDEPAFWRAMIAAPNDELPRLVYADWLDERGDPAAPILRDSHPLSLHGLVGVNRVWEPQYGAMAGQPADADAYLECVWEHRNSRAAHWHNVVAALRRFIKQGAAPDWSAGFQQLVVRRFAASPRPNAPAEWQGLTVTLPDGEPVPAFVSFLLFQLALAGSTQPAGNPAAWRHGFNRRRTAS